MNVRTDRNFSETQINAVPRSLILLPSTGTIQGGIAIRPNADNGAGGELLISNPAGRGVCVLGSDAAPALRLAPSIFDVVLTRRLGVAPRVDALAVQLQAMSVAAEGYAGRPAQRLARVMLDHYAHRKSIIERWLEMRISAATIASGRAGWLAALYALIGTPDEQEQTTRRLRLLVATSTSMQRLSEKHPLDALYATSASIIQHIASACSTLMTESMRLYEHPELMVMPGNDREFAPLQLLTLQTGWSRYCLLWEQVLAGTPTTWLQNELAALSRLLLHATPTEVIGTMLKDRALKASASRSVMQGITGGNSNLQKKIQIAENERRLCRELRLSAPKVAP